ncbi:MAG: histidine triad nucleotide-binding protein [Chromatiales bacterium]|jgi:histidine triad (HIT) family protein
MSDCIFCKIVAGDIPAEKVFESDSLIAFKDLQPQAPLHTLVIPKRHIATINDLQDGDAQLVGEMYLAAKQIATDAGYAEPGYRTVMNCNLGAGQSVFHIHLHVLAGRPMTWPPG